ncbi:hypothetical protein A9239_15185 [Methanosarcina sp. A14]|uniref:Type I restriction-modification system, specificity subunit S n=1 Tax=Methanosarcina barkeri MS TaxID=1434108 RepID=A0A0E3QV38_METBA|nr:MULTISPECIES: hypothetical protein [Methanosarcina]AKB55203.1 Type I restriction-modification system, specificity subunit S [Methanosarcina barkeri MS]OED01063.1 hypothetical protein A9239_15185 [Methanosarcina sp. A14]
MSRSRSEAAFLSEKRTKQEMIWCVGALFAFADSIEAKVTAAREKTEKLRQSILEKAFSGQLVETEAEIARREGRDYETAEVLLERIKAEKGNKKKKR